MLTRCVIIGLLVIALMAAVPVRADGIIIIDPPPPLDGNTWLTIRYHRVTVDIVDQIATTKVDQVFRNDGSGAVEGLYVFPIPPGAVIQDFVMWINGQPVESEILPADKARDIYESYVQKQRDPALLEYVGRDAVRARIFPIPPGEERRIQLEYTQVLPSDKEMLYFRYPLNTERFSNLPLEQVSVYVSIESHSDLRAIYSPSHHDDIVVTRHNTHQASLSYESNDVLPDRDFELYIGTTSETIGINLLTHQPETEDGFFLLMLTPPIESETHPILPRDIFLVLDTSGSMDGDKLQQAQEALVYILNHLNPQDRFNIIAFSSHIHPYAPELQPTTEANRAIDWVYGLEALGGTNIYLALSEALAQTDPERPTVMIFLTDGLPTEGIVDESTLLNALVEEAPSSAHIFPFGVGYDVNTIFLDQLAEEHSGSPAYVEPQEQINEIVSAFFARIQKPMLTHVALDFGGMRAYDIYPYPLPDLYAGQQLIVTGRYTNGGRQTVTLTGAVEGQRKTYSYDGDFEAMQSTDFVPRLWAARKIGALLTQIRLHGENSEWVDAVVRLSLRYGIITPYTAFLIEEPAHILTSEGRDNATQVFTESLEMTSLAPSGEEAVEDAKMRQALGASAAPPEAGGFVPFIDSDGESPVLNTIRYAGDKTFLCEGAVCTDTTYIPDKMVPHEVIFMSEIYWQLIASHPEFAAYFAVGQASFFVDKNGTPYHFRLGTEADIVRPPTNPEAAKPGAPPTATATQIDNGAQNPQPVPNNGPGLCGGAFALTSLGIVIGVSNHRGKRDFHTPM